MKIKGLIAAASLAVFAAVPASAAPVELNFSFGDVSGTFFGLNSSLTDTQRATSFFFNGVEGTYYVDDVPIGDRNSFIFASDASILDINFDYFNSGCTFPCLQQLGVEIDRNDRIIPLSVERPEDGIFVSRGGVAVLEIQPAAPIPLPAASVLLLTALGGLAAVRRRKHGISQV